jgi:preprotein translocase subunit SecG
VALRSGAELAEPADVFIEFWSFSTMQIWMTLILAVQLLSALVMIGLVLIQHGKGADMGASFGSGASGSLFGATGSANFLSRATSVCATVFFLCTLALTYISTKTLNERASSGGSSVLDRPAIGASGPGTGVVPGAIPGAAPAPTAAPAAAASASGQPGVPTPMAAPGASPSPAVPAAPAASK